MINLKTIKPEKERDSSVPLSGFLASKFNPLLPAIDQAREMFAAGGVRDFEADLQDHLRTGFVYATPGLFLMAKAVALEDGRIAWFIFHAVGDLPRLFAALPYPLPFFAFQRRHDRRMRVYSFERMKRLICTQHSEAQKPETP